MSIPYKKEADEVSLPEEKCCFCRIPTNYWTDLPDRQPGEQVAICLHCAGRAEPKDIPTKKHWCRRERIAHRPTIGEIARGEDCL